MQSFPTVAISIVCSIAGVCFGMMAWNERKELEQNQNRLEEIAVNIEQSVLQESIPEETESAILPQYRALAEQETELYGWIQIKDTTVNYPVMHTPEDPEKYLRRNMDEEYSSSGTIFMDYRCTDDSDNQILYGHNMKNGTMFGSIWNYRSEKYWKEHPIICFDTLYETRSYEVLAAFYDRVYLSDETCFKYYNFIDAVDNADYENAIQNYQDKALYATGVTAAYGDKLLTLSTCDNDVENGRFVVVAREIG